MDSRKLCNLENMSDMVCKWFIYRKMGEGTKLFLISALLETKLNPLCVGLFYYMYCQMVELSAL